MEQGTFTNSPGISSSLPDTKEEYLENEEIYSNSEFMVNLIEYCKNPYNPEDLYDNKVENYYIPEAIGYGLEKIGIKNFFNNSMQLKGNITGIIESLDNGYPLMMGIDIGGGYHAVTAFAYSENENGSYTFYAHYGYLDNSGEPIFVTINSNASEFSYAYSLIPKDNIEHKCNDNYEGGLCLCREEYHPAHLQKYTHTYTYNASEHTETCSINGFINTEAHTLTYSNSSTSTGHTLECECGYTVIESHSYTSVEHVDDETHRLTCECGYSILQYHWSTPPKVMGVGYQHWLECAVCKHRWKEDHFPCYYEWWGDTYRVLCYCGNVMYSTDTLPEGLFPSPY